MEYQKLVGRVRKHPIIVSVVFIVTAVLMLSFFSQSTEEVESVSIVKTAKVATSNSLAARSEIDLIGSVRAASSFNVTAERAGRVTRVNTSLGSSVSPGQIIIELENSSERAALL